MAALLAEEELKDYAQELLGAVADFMGDVALEVVEAGAVALIQKAALEKKND